MRLCNVLAMANHLTLVRLKTCFLIATLVSVLICCLSLAVTDHDTMHDLVARFGLWLPLIIAACLAGWCFLAIKSSPALPWHSLASALVLAVVSLGVSGAAMRAFPHEMQRLALSDGTKFMLVTKYSLSSRYFELWQADRSAPHQWQAVDGGQLTVPWYALSSPEPRLALSPDGRLPVIFWRNDQAAPLPIQTVPNNRLANRKPTSPLPVEG